jgi:mRNA-degrading endonuclease RelE of RelBE toxin-antitoxin system
VTVRVELVPYEIDYSRTARKKLEKLSDQNLERVLDGVERLAEQAFGDIEKLGSGYVAPFRHRIGDFRSYFDTRLEPPIIFIADIEKRGEAYQKKYHADKL